MSNNDNIFSIYIFGVTILTLGSFIHLGFLARYMGDKTRLGDNIYNLTLSFVYLMALFYTMAKFYLFLRGIQ